MLNELESESKTWERLMAEEDKKDDVDESEEEKKSQPSMMKLIIIMSVVFVVLLAISITAVVLIMGGDDQPESIETTEEQLVEEKKEEAKEKIEEQGKAIFYTIRPVFVVNFQKSKRAKYLQVSVDVMARSEEAIEYVENYLPLIKNDLVVLFASQSFEDLRSADGKEKLRQDALKKIQSILQKETGEPWVENVLFTSFVMQ